MTTTKLSVDDPEFVDKILSEVKKQGQFDSFRKECLADVDTQPAFQNLHTRVEDSVQKFLYRQVWTPETNKNKLREEMRTTIVKAGYLESGVNRIVDQVMEQKMDYIQSKVEEILYHYVGIAKPLKREKTESLVIDTDLMPTDLEQVSPDVLMDEIKDEEVEEEIVEDDDFESPAFEPIEAVVVVKNENSQHSNLSAISGLTSENSCQSKSEPMEITTTEVSEIQAQDQNQDSQISQFSSLQDMSQEATEVTPVLPAIEEEAQAVVTTNDAVQPLVALDDEAQVSNALDEEAQVATELNIEEPIKEDQPSDTTEQPETEDPNKSQFDLNKDSIEFTGTERKSISLDDSANSTEAEKVLQPQDVPANTMEVDNLYSNDTTDSGDVKMEIDLKDDTTQGTGESSKIEESSQDSSKVTKEKSQSDQKKDSRHKSDRSRDKHKSSSTHKSSHHSRSSSSKRRHDDKHKDKSRSDGKSRSSSSHKKSLSDKDRSSSSRREHDKDRKSKDDSSRSKHRDSKTTDDHQQEKSSSRRRRSTDHDSNDGKTLNDKGKGENSASAVVAQSEQVKPASSTDKVVDVEPASHEKTETSENTGRTIKKMLSESSETSTDSRGGVKRSSILIKYDYLKSPSKSVEAKQEKPDIADGFCGFEAEKLPDNPWFTCLRKEIEMVRKKKPTRKSSNNNYLEQQKLEKTLNLDLPKSKTKSKQKSLHSPNDATTSFDSKLTNGSDEAATVEARAHTISQQQRYTSEDLFKPRFNFGSRNRRRGGAVEEAPAVEEATKPSSSELEIPS